MTERRITKVRHKSGRVEVHEIETEGGDEDGRTSEIVTRCAEEPATSFVEAMAALREHVGTIMEWPEGYADGRLEVTGVSYSKSKNEVEGAVISGFVRLAKADGAWSWNTPHMPFEAYGDGGGQSVMEPDAVKAVQLVRAEARKYLGGERAQIALFGEQAAGPEPAEADA